MIELRTVGKLALICALTIAAPVAVAAEKHMGTTSGKAPAVVITKKMTGAANNGAIGTRATAAVPLTAEECTGLGGKITGSDACRSRNLKSCATVDPNGVIRTRCIDEVSE